jgi:dienelactone hydrolase
MRFAVAFLALTLAAQTRFPPTPEQRRLIADKTAELQSAIDQLRPRVSDEVLVDAEVYLKAARWIVRFDEFYAEAYAAQTLAVLDSGLERARLAATGEPPWVHQTGSVCRAYRSRVDGSVQPYAITVPPGYTGASPAWLEVVLHGRGDTQNEVSFLYSHGRARPQPANHPFLQLDVWGRGNNAYRWAGETDVFEAIDSVRTRYRIDPERIVLRGFSMGGAGAWHLGLHFPDQWAAMEAGAGFVDTQVYAKVANPPPYVTIYDALDYAANATAVPTVGYGGEDDPQLRASVAIREELEHEGYAFHKDGYSYLTEALQALFLVGPKTQHKFEPEAKKKSDAFLLSQQSHGILEPSAYRFVTYTERYNRCFRVTIDQLERQYQRAQVDVHLAEHITEAATRNVARLTLHGGGSVKSFRIDGQTFPAKVSATFERVKNSWRAAGPLPALSKQHALQGPIDDAFLDGFVCVKPASAGASPADAFALGQLDRFAEEFAHWMRGDIRIKTDRDLTAADQTGFNVVAFGTPASNPLIARVLEWAPIRWDNDAIVVGSRRFDAATHLLAMVYPNPDNPRRYLAINSGHTFHEADFRGTNALLYPRAGDWAVIDITDGKTVAEGAFDRNWQLEK